MDEWRRFRDREEAGRELGERLREYAGDPEVVVYALPRGGVAVGEEVARRLGAPLDLIVARKIGHPEMPEYAIGAVAEDGEVIMGDREKEWAGTDWFTRAVERQREEIRRRKAAYLGGRGRIDPSGKISIVVDDGVATGLTMEAAIGWLKGEGPKKIVVAVPVASAEEAGKLRRMADEVVVLISDKNFLGAVGSYYEQFGQVTDEEVVRILNRLKSPL